MNVIALLEIELAVKYFSSYTTGTTHNISLDLFSTKYFILINQ